MTDAFDMAGAAPARRGQLGMRLRRVTAALLGAAAIVAAPVAASAETLADALAAAYNNSGLLEQNRALLRAADEDVAATVSRLRPIINWTADVTHDYTRSPTVPGPGSTRNGDTDLNAGITAQLLLYDFGRVRFQIEAAKESVLATRQALIGIEQQVLLRAVQAYMNVQRNYQFVALRESNVRLIRESLRAARDRFDVGEVTRTDVSQAEARLASAQSALAAARGDLSRAVEEYIAAIGNKPGRLATPRQAPTITRDEETAKQVALRAHPDILKAQHDVSTAELNVQAAEAAMAPTINLNGSVGVNRELSGSSFGDRASVGIGISGPIYQGGLLSSTKRRAIALRDAQRGALHTTAYSVAQNVGNAYAVLQSAQAVLRSSEEQVRAARVAFEGVREEARLGARTTLDVLNAEQEYLDARTNRISARVDVFIASYAVLEATGNLTVRDLNLAVQTYDPAAYYNLVKNAPARYSTQGQKLDRVIRALGKE